MLEDRTRQQHYLAADEIKADGIFHYYRQWHRTQIANESSSLQKTILESQEKIFRDLEERRPRTIFLEGLTLNKGESSMKNFHNALISRYGQDVHSVFNINNDLKPGQAPLRETDSHYEKGMPLKQKQKDMLYQLDGALIHACLATDIEVLATCTKESNLESVQAQNDQVNFADYASKKNNSSQIDNWSNDDQIKYDDLLSICDKKINVRDKQLVALLITFRRQRPNDDAGVVMGARHDVPLLLREKNPSASIKMIDHLSRAPIVPTRADMPE